MAHDGQGGELNSYFVNVQQVSPSRSWWVIDPGLVKCLLSGT